jgi:tetratricopeptide (TPR) repeat protein
VSTITCAMRSFARYLRSRSAAKPQWVGRPRPRRIPKSRTLADRAQKAGEGVGRGPVIVPAFFCPIIRDIVSAGVVFRAILRIALTAAFFLPACMPSAWAAEWVLARTARLEVYSDAGAENARAVLLWFERLRTFFQQQTGVEANPRLPLRVVYFRSAEEYETYRLRPNSDAYYASAEGRDYIVLSGGGPADKAVDKNAKNVPARIGAHEYWHFVEHTGALRLPHWLNEGLAEFFSTVRLEERDGRVGAEPGGHVRVLRTRAWIPLASLLTLTGDSPLHEQRDTSEVFYAESWGLAHMLMLSPDYYPRFRTAVERLASGMPGPQVLESVYSKPLDTIARDLRSWIERGRYAPLFLPGAATDPISIDVKDASAFSVHAILADLMAGMGRRDRAEAMYRELAGEAPDDASVAAALAILALERNDLEEARRQWTRSLAQGIRDAGACYRFAKLAEDAGISSAEVRAALERAVALQPEFEDALFTLALFENNAGEHAAALEHLRAMRTISPGRQFHYWTAMSDALNEVGRRAEAKAAADTAKTWAATEEQRAYAERLAVAAQTDLAVRFTRDAAGNLYLQTARAPRGAPDWNPFIEPGDRVRRVEARLREIDCAGAATIFVIEAASALLKLTLPDPTHVQMRNAPPEFTCGPQPAPEVVAVYAETGPAAGLLRGLEFR